MMNILRVFVAMLACAVVGATFVSAEAAPRAGQLMVVQAVPGLSVEVSLDGRTVSKRAGTAAVLGPFDVSPGSHVVRFADSSGEVTMTSRVQMRPGASSDVVLHLPAAVDADPVVHVYKTPGAPIGAGKARVLVAHTATVPPADVRVDGQTVFTNIANGEFATAEVPAGPHEVALLPTGEITNPILGPLEFSLAPRTVTRVYAIGNPSNDSMELITSSRKISSDGTVAPKRMDTGSAGLAGKPGAARSAPTTSWTELLLGLRKYPAVGR